MDVFESLGVEPIINAGGTLTRLSGSVLLPEVAETMVAASRQFVDMEELHVAAGRRIAELVGVPAAHVCSSATAGIAVMAAAIMAGTDRERVRALPDTQGRPNRWVAQSVHRNPFDQALRVAGGEFVEVGADAEEMSKALEADDVVGCFYTFSWFNVGPTLALPEVVDLARRAGKPVIVDAAAEVPPVGHLQRFIDEGADLVTFSGGKALRGPQASGFILGRDPQRIAACAANDSPNMSIGRGMKVGKEEICGVVRAVELYVAHDHEADQVLWDRRVGVLLQAVQDLPVNARRQLPYGEGQQIPHMAVSWKADALQGRGCQDVATALKAGSPRIACQLIHEPVYGFARDSGPELRFHVHTLQEGEDVIVARALRTVLEES